jgi:competence protein ComEC
MRGNPSRNINLAISVTLLVGCGIWFSFFRNVQANPVSDDQTKINFLDVGQGDATLINMPNSMQILIDAGRDASVLDGLAKKMPKFDRKIEYVLLTHPDADHIGGFENVLESYQVGEVIKTEKTSDSKLYGRILDEISKKNIPVVVPKPGQVFSFSGGDQLKVFSPDPAEVEGFSSNDSSIISRFSSPNESVFSLGDAEVASQNEVLAKFPSSDLKSDILKVSHHGAQSGLDKKMYEAVSPKTAVISVGKNNSYGHPHQVVLDALNNLAIKILRTDQMGTISL